MKKKEFKDLETKTEAELAKLVVDLRGQVTKVKLDLAARRLKNTNVIKNLRRDLARNLTVLRQKQLAHGENIK